MGTLEKVKLSVSILALSVTVSAETPMEATGRILKEFILPCAAGAILASEISKGPDSPTVGCLIVGASVQKTPVKETRKSNVTPNKVDEWRPLGFDK